MKKQEVEVMIKENTTEDGLNIDNITSMINDHVNSISTKNLEKEAESLKGRISNDVRNQFLTEYGFENVDQFSAFVKTSKANTNETKEALNRTQTEFSKLNEEYSTLKTQFNEVNSKLTHISNINLAKDKGIKNDMLDYAIFEAQKLVSDELSLEDVIDSFKESKPMLFNEQQQQRIKVGNKVGDKTPKVTDEAKEKLSKKYPWLK